MNKYLLILIAIGLALLSACNGKDPINDPDPEPTGTEYKVAIVFPQDEWDSVKPTVEWAKEEAEKANPGVILTFEWIDENGSGMASKVKSVTHDNAYAAVIGPEYSSSARVVARESLSYKIPVLMPMVTSTEFHRVYAETNKSEPNIFCLAQSDVTQCEAVIAKAKQDGVKTFLMLCRSGEVSDYSASFEQNIIFLCLEAKLEDCGYANYDNKEHLEMLMDVMISMEEEYGDLGFFFVPSSVQDMLDFDKIMTAYKGKGNLWPVYCADIAHLPQLESQLSAGPYEGFSLGATESFKNAWNARFGTALPGGYAQLYDCVGMVAAAASKVENGSAKTVREALEDLVFSGSGYSGASGKIHFGADAPIAPEEVIYQNWTFKDGKFSIVASAPHNIEKGWDWSAMNIEDYSDDIPDDSKHYFPLKGHQALIVATSTGWSNYRHQADALAMYQMLKGAGYTDDQIILIMEDDVANYASNPYPGEVRVLPGGPDLRKGAVIDYKLSDLAPEDLYHILVGVPTEKVPVVIDGGGGTNNVFVFWSGHGVRDDELKWGSQTITSEMIEKATHDAQVNYRKMFFVMDTCYSGSIPAYCHAGGLLFLCSAAKGEPSHADVYDPVCGTYLSNGFTRAFRSAVEANPDITLNDLYKEVARETTGSHAGMYNYWQYGSLKKNTFREYLPN